MHITTVRARELTATQLEAWSSFQLADPALDSPYFRPEFTQAVAAVRDDAEVAILAAGGEPVGFFPFQRTRWNTGQPIGGKMSDFQGVICRRGTLWSAEDLIRGCGLAAWDFDHLVSSQQPFQPYHWKTAPSPYMDLSEGFESYRTGVEGQTISQVLRKGRKLGREVGTLRLEAHTADQKVFQSLLSWKTDQYRRTSAPNVFAQGWTSALLERILELQTPDFCGMLTALYAGDQLAAVHLGMRSRTVLHCWFPAYNQKLQRYSPGLILWTEMAQAAGALGIRRVNFGRGEGQYKTSLMSGATEVAEGFVACRPLSGLWRHGARRAGDWVRNSRLHAPARLLKHVHTWLTS